MPIPDTGHCSCHSASVVAKPSSSSSSPLDSTYQADRSSKTGDSNHGNQITSPSGVAGVARAAVTMETRKASSPSNDWICLNVGGQVFMTTRNTLRSQEPDSMLAKMFSDDPSTRLDSFRDQSGAYLIDRSPRYFDCILNYLRHGKIIVEPGLAAAGLLEEARFFGLNSMTDRLEDIVLEESTKLAPNGPLQRKDVVAVLIGSSCQSTLRFQAVNLEKADLSLLDLQGINFKYANLRRANLSGANMSNCNLERANLADAVMDGAQLSNVIMQCTNLEGASMQACNFEGGNCSSLEGANCKNANLEGSQMCGVNLRVATLKKANLKNCVLRNAVLAGADLEDCDLAGCNLDQANLRGANFVGASFEFMITPLHMSQTIN